VRVIDVSPMLLDELKLHRADAKRANPDDLFFCTSKGTPLNRNNIRTRVVGKTVAAASENLTKAGRPRIADGVTNHSLRRTFASLLYEAGASPAYVMLEVYAKKMVRSRDTGVRMDTLIRGADWALSGTNGANSFTAVAHAENEEASATA
jgi:integrase